MDNLFSNNVRGHTLTTCLSTRPDVWTICLREINPATAFGKIVWIEDNLFSKESDPKGRLARQAHDAVLALLKKNASPEEAYSFMKAKQAEILKTLK